MVCMHHGHPHLDVHLRKPGLIHVVVCLSLLLLLIIIIIIIVGAAATLLFLNCASPLLLFLLLVSLLLVLLRCSTVTALVLRNLRAISRDRGLVQCLMLWVQGLGFVRTHVGIWVWFVCA
jgi:hypothetical protein